MLFLRIENKNSEPFAKPSNAISVEFGDYRVAYLKDALYTFHSEKDSGILIGEAECCLNDGILDDLMNSVARPQPVLMSRGRHIFDFAYIDKSKSELTLSLSAYCCRPLYYFIKNGRIIVSTHISKLKESGVTLEMEDNVLPEFAVYRHIVPPRTLYRGISKLTGGETLKIDLQSMQIIKRKTWSFHDGLDIEESADKRLEKIEDMLRQDLNELIGSFRKPGVLLSGGLDSTSLASIAREIKEDINSCSSSFSFLNKNDREDDYALTASRELNIDHSLFAASPESYLVSLVEAIHAAEEPVHHLQSALLYLLFQKLKPLEIDLLICGEGADGIFGNDAHVRVFKYKSLLKSTRAFGVQQLFGKVMGRSLEKNERYGFFAYDFGKNLRSHRHFLWTLGQFADIDLVKTSLNTTFEKILSNRIRLMRDYPEYSLLDMITIISLLSEAFESMTIWGKLAEANNIAITYPYTNPAIIHHVTSLPWEFKLKESKYVIRSLLRRRGISGKIINRPKLSFGCPSQHWALPGKLFQPLVDMAADMFDRELLRSLQSSEIKRAMLLWNLVNIYLWHSIFIKNESPGDLNSEILDRHKKAANKKSG